MKYENRIHHIIINTVYTPKVQQILQHYDTHEKYYIKAWSFNNQET